MTTELDIKEWFEENNYKSEIELAKRIQLQNQVYTIPFSKIREGNKEFEKILERVELKIGNPKTFSTFKANISYPLEVSKFVNNKIFKALSKIWQGEGGYINRYPDDKDSSHTPDREFYSTNVWKRYITNPNDLIMLNVNSDNEIDWHFINIADVEYLDFNYSRGDYELTKIVYKEDKDTYVFATTEDWGKFEMNGSTPVFIDNYPKAHKFGFNPCTFISSELYNNKPVVRKNNITDSLGQLEDLFFSSVSRCVVDKHSLPYTVIAGKKGCNFDDGTRYCQDGYLKIKTAGENDSYYIDESDIFLTDEKGSALRCPVCGNNNLGYGSLIEINSTDHTAEDTAKLIANAVNFATLDIESLRYPSERKAEIEEHLYNEIIGVSETFNPKQQQNEIRIMSAYEGKLDVVFDTKAVFEKVMSSVDTKAMKMKYPAFKKSVINLGDNFYLLNEIEYQEAIAFGNKNRIEGYIDNKRGLIEVKFKNNKNERDRKILIYKLEKAIVKFPYLNNEQIVTLYDSEKISDKDFFINQNFYSIIEEIEMLDEKNRFINEILDEMTYKDKLKFINDNINKKWQEREKTAISQ